MKIIPREEALSRNNRYLIVDSRVILTDIIDPVIHALDDKFREVNVKGIVTSGLRDQNKQLEIIKDYCISSGIAKEYPEILTCKADSKRDDGKYIWQFAWSKLLNIGYIINPPYAAAPLLDYMRNGKNLKGVTIPPSIHFFGKAFDIGGQANGIEDEDALVTPLVGKIKGLVGTTKERNNNCLHCDCN